jgi:hypothetical protein
MSEQQPVIDGGKVHDWPVCLNSVVTQTQEQDERRRLEDSFPSDLSSATYS